MKTLWLLAIECLLIMNGCSKNDDKRTVTDIDGNIYHTVTIGSQVWMVENLKVTRYRNGDLIGTTNPDSADINGETTPKYQWAYNGDERNVTDYGRLYTWFAVMDNRNICPVGWHIPSNEEWTELTDYLGGQNFAGSKLKEKGLSHWVSSNSDATNETGFTALPGGYRAGHGVFYVIGYDGFWWSSSEINASCAYGRNMESGYTGVIPDEEIKLSGLSVRCVKD
jgi:uncharacterized protein (TIGR02145 family)